MIEATWEPEVCELTFRPRSARSGVPVVISGSLIDLESTHSLALTDAVRRELASTGYLELRSLQVRMSDELVELVGHVPSYYLKQLAQSAVKRVPGVAQVVNAIEVVKGR